MIVISAAVPRTRKFPLPDGTEAQGEVIGFRPNAEHWNDYLLDDGTVIRVKLIVTDVVRLEGQYDAAGNPAYIVQSQNVTSVDAPDELRKG